MRQDLGDFHNSQSYNATTVDAEIRNNNLRQELAELKQRKKMDEEAQNLRDEIEKIKHPLLYKIKQRFRRK